MLRGRCDRVRFVLNFVLPLLVYLGAIYLGLALFPGEMGENLRKAYEKLLTLLWKVPYGCFALGGKLLCKLLLRLVKGRKVS